MKTTKSFWSISLLVSAMFVMVLACSSNSDDNSGGGGGSTAGSGGTSAAGTGGGSAAGSGGTSAAGTGGGSAGTGASGSGASGSGAMDAGPDGSTDLPQNVAEGQKCGVKTIAFTSTGICQKPSADCAGGLPTSFDLSSLGGLAKAAFPKPDNDQANCATGLVCCIDTDACEKSETQVNDFVNGMNKSDAGMTMGEATIKCVDKNACTAAKAGDNTAEFRLGCPKDKNCCTSMAPVNAPEGGASTTTADATTW